MHDITGEIYRNLNAMQIPPLANVLKAAFTNAAAAVGTELVKEKSYYLMATEDCHVQPETLIADANATVAGIFIPAFTYIPFMPWTGKLFLSVIRDTVNGDLYVIPAVNCRVG